MFKINHYANSFISVEGDNSIIICDPWVGKTNDNGWYSYPIKNISDIKIKKFKTNFVYISHLHCDHLDFKTLKNIVNSNTIFIIKKFEINILKKRIQQFCKNRVIELDPFKKTKINKDFSVAIVPQIISNSSDLPDNINYDLDTSIIIQSNKDKTIFFNNVDTPMNLNVLKKIKKFITSNFKRNVDVFCYALGAASEFPQCFMNINRGKEQKRIINESLEEIYSYIKFLKPKIFFPAGGTYAIYGKFYKLNKFIAQPTSQQIEKKLSKLNTKVYDLIGGGSILFNKDNFYISKKPKIISSDFHKKFLNQIKKLKYYYETNEKVDLPMLDKTFYNAKQNYFKILGLKNKINTKWNIDFKIYKNYQINDKYLIDKKKSKFLKTYNLKNYTNNSPNIYKLECHLEYELFKSLLNKKFPWNTSLSGSTIMYRRNPNKYNVDMFFSLNFLRV